MIVLSLPARPAAWLGALLLAASLPANSLAGIVGSSVERSQPAPSVCPEPGRGGAPHSGRHVVLQVQGCHWGRVLSLGGGRRRAPVLACLDRIDGVENSVANESGTLVRLSLRPGADPQKVTAEARRILSEQVEDRVPVPLDGQAAATALREETWDLRQAAEFPAIELPATMSRSPGLLLLALLLACAAIGVGLWWRRLAIAWLTPAPP